MVQRCNLFTAKKKSSFFFFFPVFIAGCLKKKERSYAMTALFDAISISNFFFFFLLELTGKAVNNNKNSFFFFVCVYVCELTDHKHNHLFSVFFFLVLV